MPVKHYQRSWEREWDFLDYDGAKDRVWCRFCSMARQSNFELCRVDGADRVAYSDAWTKEGFSSWRKGRERIAVHKASSAHRQSKEFFDILNSENTVGHLLTAEYSSQQRENRVALSVMLQAVHFLARQGLAFRGHENSEGNYRQLINLLSKHSKSLGKYMERKGKMKWVNWDTQNSLIEAFGAEVLGRLVTEVADNEFFSVIMDETTDTSTIEQVSIVLRTVSEDLVPSELFIGLFDTVDSTAESLTNLLVSTINVISNGALDIKQCRGQCYDGAANMRGHITGVQTRIRALQPKALFAYCSGHMLNLVLKDAAESIPITATAIEFAKTLCNFCTDSAKRVAQFRGTIVESDIFDEIAGDEGYSENGIIGVGYKVRGKAIRSLCPTRWVLRKDAIDSIIINYEKIMSFLDDMADGKSSEDPKCRTKAASLLKKAEEFSTYFGLACLRQLFSAAHPIHKYMQSPSVSVMHIRDLVMALETEYAAEVGIVPEASMKEDKAENRGELFFTKCVVAARHLFIDPPKLKTSRASRAGRSTDSEYGGAGEVTLIVSEAIKEWYIAQYTSMYQAALTSIRIRYDSEALKIISSAENIITQKVTQSSEAVDLATIIDHWGTTDLGGCAEELKRDVRGFHHWFKVHPEKALDSEGKPAFDLRKLDGVVEALSRWPAGRITYPVLTRLVRLLLVVPSTSCEAERTFSALRRLKNLRSTMTQERLRSLAVCHVHRSILDSVDHDKIVEQWIGGSSQRMNTFGGVSDSATEAVRARKQADVANTEAIRLEKEAKREEAVVRLKRRHEAAFEGDEKRSK